MNDTLLVMSKGQVVLDCYATMRDDQITIYSSSISAILRSEYIPYIIRSCRLFYDVPLKFIYETIIGFFLGECCPFSVS